MTERATLESLFARVLKGTGPDRELDAEIALAFGIVAQRAGNCFYGHNHYSVMVLDRDYYDHDGNAPELPRYTASLDAALTLVPEGWTWARFHSGVFECAMLDDRRALFARGDAATPPRVLIASCLKARMEALGD